MTILIGAVLRVNEIGQSLFADEMWTYLSATKPDLGGMLDFVRSDEEITPPLFATLAWFSAQLGDATVLIRLPSIIAGILTIPLVWVIGMRTFGRRVALLAAVLVALSPFLAYYSVEARAYSLAYALAAASTVCLLLALERRQAAWWVGYGVASCAAMYSHYTTAFVLAAQVGWVLWFHRDSWRPVLLANAAAAAAFLPWLPGFLDDFNSPSQDVFEAIAPFNSDNAIGFIGDWALGHPPANGLQAFWGLGLELVLFAGIAAGVLGLVFRLRGPADANGDDWLEAPSRAPVALVVLLAVATPVGVILVSLVGHSLLLPRNLGTSSPYLAVALAALLASGPRAARLPAIGIVVAVFAIGAVRITTPVWQRPDVRDAARVIDSALGPDDVVFDVASPLSTPDLPTAMTLDVHLEDPHIVLEPKSLEQIDQALADTAGGRLGMVGPPVVLDRVSQLPQFSSLELIVDQTFDGALVMAVRVYEIPAAN